MNLKEEFNEYRSQISDNILAQDNKVTKRIFDLDTYANGNIDITSKEMIGLACSTGLRFDEYVKHHLGKCHETG